MQKTSKQHKAIALISGGLDSLLAAKVVMEQGIYLEGVNFYTGFCVEGHTSAIRTKHRNTPKRNNALWVAEQLGIKLHIIDISEEYKDVVLNPKHGYGKNLNPCLDCKIFMVEKTLGLGKLEHLDFDFIVTGEVIGQRPKSQRKETLPLIAKESGANDRLLRPLCAKNLLPTLPEREGWIRRDQLYDFHGRNRKPQIALAETFGFEDYAQPAGGCCFLTDESYSNKLGDLWSARGERDYSIDDIMLLKVGRHLRPYPHFKLIIGRDEGENRYLQGYRSQFDHLTLLSHKGPAALIDGQADDEEAEIAAKILARYSQGKNSERVEVALNRKNGSRSNLSVVPFHSGDLPVEWHVGS